MISLAYSFPLSPLPIRNYLIFKQPLKEWCLYQASKNISKTRLQVDVFSWENQNRGQVSCEIVWGYQNIWISINFLFPFPNVPWKCQLFWIYWFNFEMISSDFIFWSAFSRSQKLSNWQDNLTQDACQTENEDGNPLNPVLHVVYPPNSLLTHLPLPPATKSQVSIFLDFWPWKTRPQSTRGDILSLHESLEQVGQIGHVFRSVGAFFIQSLYLGVSL